MSAHPFADPGGQTRFLVDVELGRPRELPRLLCDEDIQFFRPIGNILRSRGRARRQGSLDFGHYPIGVLIDSGGIEEASKHGAKPQRFSSGGGH
jgi:hypothetical protein